MSYPTSAILNGANVSLFNLKNEHYNGLSGICCGAQNGRYVIEVDGTKILIKRENIKVIPPSPINIQKLTPELCLGKNSQWAKGLELIAAAEWFIDCYRMRIDDEYCLKGNFRGLYNVDHTKKEIVLDFLLHCHLARFNQVIPENWDWALCLNKFGYLLGYAFEKDDAREKYGSENYFSGMLGGRSLRFTGEIIYRNPLSGSGEISEEVTNSRKEQKKIEAAIKRIRWESGEALFEDVGGFPIWKKLLKTLNSQN
ncbi:hypothetical protein HK096_010310 [Nowakowskiella sp. JEL0078]|nr:hypothetical protein HK096_010310 [Nowakowskiella sp. JEL0078]